MQKIASFVLKIALESGVDIYRNYLRIFMLPSCKFLPTCSEYAKVALNKHGALKGVRLIARRLLRCCPFSLGGFDPVP